MSEERWQQTDGDVGDLRLALRVADKCVAVRDPNVVSEGETPACNKLLTIPNTEAVH